MDDKNEKQVDKPKHEDNKETNESPSVVFTIYKPIYLPEHLRRL